MNAAEFVKDELSRDLPLAIHVIGGIGIKR